MNYNFSNNLNFIQFLTFKPQNTLYDTKYLVSCISEALKRSLNIYQTGLKIHQNLQNTMNLSSISSGQTASNFEPKKKKSPQKYSKIPEQNKKSIQKLSCNQLIKKNDKNQSLIQQKLKINQQKYTNQQQKISKYQSQYTKIKSKKIIHQNNRKQHNFQHFNVKKRIKNFIDLYQGAYIPANNLSIEQIQLKREKLLLRKVLNWKEIDKKVGFRKMQLKKLLT